VKSRYGTFLILGISMVVLMSGCKNNNIVGTTAPVTAVITGVVVSSSSPTPIAGATVTLSYGNTKDSVVTGSDGIFQFLVEVSDTSKGINVTLTVRETGYLTKVYNNINVKGDQTIPVSLDINATTYAIINGVVQDSVSKYPLAGSSVIISLSGSSSSMARFLSHTKSHVKSVSSFVIDSTTALANGSFVLTINLYDLDSLSATMTVSKAGFVTYQIVRTI